MEPIKVIIYGTGAMGCNMARLLRSKPGIDVVGAIDHDPKKIGKDLGDIAQLGELTGIRIEYPPEKVLERVNANVVLLSMTAFLDEAIEPITNILKRGMNIVTICQELFFPIGRNIDKARRIDSLAREYGAMVTATGINPGFIMDIVPVVCSFPCWEIHKVFTQRVVDFSPYGPDEMKHIGVGLTIDAFQKGIKNGEIGHIGLLETVAMVSYCLGFQIDELRQTKEPVITSKERKSDFITIQPGRVCGFRQNVTALKNGNPLLDFRMIGLIAPDAAEDGVKLGDYCRISGIPNVDIRITEEISQKGGLGTAGAAVNIIPKVLAMKPGFYTMNQLTLPHIWNSSNPPPPIQNIFYGSSE
ncbi:MAG: hypothetical protein AB1798_06320 [Spirochaetota bacterium]